MINSPYYLYIFVGASCKTLPIKTGALAVVDYN